MGKLKILASGSSTQARAQARGKLFEVLMAEVLQQLGYKIDRIPNINYAGMEIDIEGKAIATGVPLYAECKCYETNVDSQKLQAFYGKYMTRWRKDRRSQGLFIALPGVNSHAKGFYREYIESDSEIAVRLLEEDDVLEVLFKTKKVVQPETISKNILTSIGTPGDCILLHTDKGMFWVQYIIPVGKGIPGKITIFNSNGDPILDKSTVDYLTQLWPELGDFEIITVKGSITLQAPSAQQETEEIVEVKGSSTCFEYQFPASPEHFVGRQHILEEVDSNVRAVINKETSSRGILFEANSGWGKSSVVLACVKRLRQKGHFAIAIDSRSASSSQFVLRVVDYSLAKFGDFDGILSKEQRSKTITGFEGAVKALLHIGQVLERHSKVVFIFLDQFENLFFLHDALRRVRDLFFKVQDAQTNVVLGFSWKTDLVGLTSEFPYRIRDAIADSSKRIILNTFSNVETNALLDKLREELGVRTLRKDLRFFLSEFSQGYPWLLKKLCAHVKTQIENGTPQADIAYSLLNIEELFQEDLRGLSSEEEDVLRRIAKLAPISVQELGEEFNPEVIQSLVHRRLLVRIGNKYDVYWDIFRDYLNSGRVPVQENYILRTQVGSVLRAIKLLVESSSNLSTSDFQKRTNLSEKSLYNVLRDMRLLGFIRVDKGNITLLIDLPEETEPFEEALRNHLRERLKRNRLIWHILKALEDRRKLTISEVSKLLENSCPYISATGKTWHTYARSFAKWMDLTDLAIYNSKEGILSRYTLGAREVRDLRPFLAGRRGGMTIPPIQYTPIERAAIRLVDALRQGSRVNWGGLKKSTVAKSLVALEELGFIRRKPGSIILLPDIEDFVNSPEKRPKIFAKAALKNIRSFAVFIDILQEHKKKKVTLAELGMQLKERLNVDWKKSTAEVNAKILLDWARHANLAPRSWALKRRRKSITTQAMLFSNFIKKRKRGNDLESTTSFN